MKYLVHFTLISLICISCESNSTSPTDQPVIIRDTIRVVEHQVDTVYIEQKEDDAYYIQERLPFWINETGLLNGLIFQEKYKYDNRLNPLYLEADFNGDQRIDIAIPIEEIKTGKKGIAVIHGGTNTVHIIGAGTMYKNGVDDDISWYDIWLVNRNRINPPGVDGTENLLLKNPSIQVEKSEIGGGQLFWNGKEYEYFHQTC